jgi:hypothetical protein
MVIEIDNSTLEGKTKDEIIEIIKNILNFDLNHPGVYIFGGSLEDLQQKPRIITRGS